jgi:hypothetical protein
MDTDLLTDMILAEHEEDLEEVAKFKSRHTEKRGTKIGRAASQMSTYEGRRKNDILYHKMVRYRDLYYKYRDLLKKKYRAKNSAAARE